MSKYFIRVTAGRNEWGFVRDFIPAVGDVLQLPYAHRDEESGDYVKGVVAQREFFLDEPQGDQYEVWLEVELQRPLAEDEIPDSEAWPSVEYSIRAEEHKLMLQRVRTEQVT